VAGVGGADPGEHDDRDAGIEHLHRFRWSRPFPSS
jgi:hypothetical protein